MWLQRIAASQSCGPALTWERGQLSLIEVATALSLDVGVLYSGVYEIGQRLGVGGTGAVYRARHVILQQERALKILHPQTFGGPRFLERLQLEASVFGRLKGEPSLVMPFDLGFDRVTGTHFLAMELLEGCDLATWVQAQGPLNVKTTLSLMRQVARGLDAAHRYVNPSGRRTPIVHRDLTPTNIFVVKPEQAEPVAKILDFGLAHMLDESSRVHGRRSGTPLYRSYEQAQGLEVVPQTDIWALALVVHFALTGRPYWVSRHTDDLQDEITSAPLEAPGQRLRRHLAGVKLPNAFDDWFLRCLRRLPGSRFASAGEAVDELALCFSDSAFDLNETVVSVEPPQVRNNTPRVHETMAQSRTVSRVEEALCLDPEAPAAILAEYVTSVHPVLKSVVRLGDDLMTATGHYLAFAPDSLASLGRQLDGVSHAISLYNAASERMRGPLGEAAFARGIEQTVLGAVGSIVADGLNALLALPERYAAPSEVALRWSSRSGESPARGLAPASVPSSRDADNVAEPDVLSEYCAHSTHWQTERVRLHARVEVAKRALTETERRIENAILTDAKRTVTWVARAQAAAAAESLTQSYVEHLEMLGVAIGDWLEVIGPDATVGGGDVDASDAPARVLPQAAWRLAEPIEAMNACYVRLEERALELRVALLGSTEPGSIRSVQTLSDIQAFQWYEVRPQLNGLIVNVIRLLCAEDTAQVARLLGEDYRGWERLRRLLTRTRFATSE